MWFEGEKVEDVTSHRIVRTCVEVGAMDYSLAQDPRYQDLLIEQDENGERYHSKTFSARIPVPSWKNTWRAGRKSPAGIVYGWPS